MASVNFEKIKSASQLRGMLLHCDKETRQAHDHSNRHIDKSQTVNNLQGDMTYKETYEHFKETLTRLDDMPNANKRKDRVLAFGLEIPFPPGISDIQGFANKVYDIAQKQYPEAVFLNAYVHTDEKHKYVDAETKKIRESLDHMHIFVMPVQDDRLNGKDFSSRKNMRSLNNAIQEMCQRDYGLDFMNGTKKKSRDSVETLKNKSDKEALALKLRRVKKKEADLKQQEADLRLKEQEAEKKYLEAQKMQSEASESLQRTNELQVELQEKISLYENLPNQVKEQARLWREHAKSRASASSISTGKSKQNGRQYE